MFLENKTLALVTCMSNNSQASDCVSLLFESNSCSLFLSSIFLHLPLIFKAILSRMIGVYFILPASLSHVNLLFAVVNFVIPCYNHLKEGGGYNMIDAILNFIERFSDLIGVILQCVTTFSIFFLAFRKDRYMQKIDSFQQRFKQLYSPFYRKILVGCFSNEHRLSSAPIETRSIFLDLFSQNVEYMSATSQALYTNFYFEFLNLLEAYNGNPDYPFKSTAKNFDIAFIQLSQELLSDYAYICRRLQLPKPLSFFQLYDAQSTILTTLKK